MKPGPAGVPRIKITRLLRQGLSNRAIGARLHTDSKRVARIRSEVGIPAAVPAITVTRDEAWAVFAEPVDGGHMRWIGYLREGTCPVLKYRSVDYSARRIAFEIGHGRPPVGRVLPSCDYPGCIAPKCTTDQPMRRADHLYTAIFGTAA